MEKQRGIKITNTDETKQCTIHSVRQSALKWWNELPQSETFRLTGKYGFKRRRCRSMLTDRELQHIYECVHSA